MPEKVRIDEFVFVLLAGLVLIIIFMLAWTSPPTEKPPETKVVVGEVAITPVEDPTEVEIKYAIGVRTLDSKKNREILEGLFKSEDIGLVAEISESELADVKDGSVELVIESTNALKPLIVIVNGKEVYRDIPSPGRLSIPIKKNLLKVGSNSITIKTEFPGLLRFWQTARYKISLAEFRLHAFGFAVKNYDFELERAVIRNFKYGRLKFDVINRVGEAALTVKINDNVILKGVAPIGTQERSFGYTVLKEGKNILSFSAEPDVTYTLKDIALTIIYERR